MPTLIYADSPVGRRMRGVGSLGADRTPQEKWKIIGEWVAEYVPRMERVRKPGSALRNMYAAIAAERNRLAPAFVAGAIVGERDATAVDNLYYQTRTWYQAIRDAETVYGSDAPGANPLPVQEGWNALDPPPTPVPTTPFQPAPAAPPVAEAGMGWLLPVGLGALALVLFGGLLGGRKGR